MSTRNRRSEEKEKYERGERKATIHSPILRFLSSFLSKIMIVKKKKNEAFAKAAVISSRSVGNPCATITDAPSMHSTYLSDANLETLGLSDNFPTFNHGQAEENHQHWVVRICSRLGNRLCTETLVICVLVMYAIVYMYFTLIVVTKHLKQTNSNGTDTLNGSVTSNDTSCVENEELNC